MLEVIRAMPRGVLLFMAYCFLVLAIIGLTMPIIIDRAVTAPITFEGMLWMLILAYLIFTMTLVLQKKQAAFGLSMGLTSLMIPLALIMLFAPGGFVISIAALILFAVVVLALRRPRSREWFSEP